MLLAMTACGCGGMKGGAADRLGRITVSADRTHFERARSEKRWVAWGFNYDHDQAGRLLEEYWADDWSAVAADFRAMKAMGANVVRVHLQFGRFMRGADAPDEANLARLADLVRLAEATGLYLNVTGLGCYRKTATPTWYDALAEPRRWAAQARFWRAVAGVCRGSPAIFCYDLMNEPIIGGAGGGRDWLPGEPLGGFHYVQRITLDPGDRPHVEIAAAWIATLASAIRAVDDSHLITVGVIPWAQVFPGARPLFYSPRAAAPLDFVSIHLYPEAGKIDQSLLTLKTYAIGKPLVIEEIFPLRADLDATVDFIRRAAPSVQGWFSFYWGDPAAAPDAKSGAGGALVREWLVRYEALSHELAGER